jgi:hypothetical protein
MGVKPSSFLTVETIENIRCDQSVFLLRLKYSGRFLPWCCFRGRLRPPYTSGPLPLRFEQHNCDSSAIFLVTEKASTRKLVVEEAAIRDLLEVADEEVVVYGGATTTNFIFFVVLGLILHFAGRFL